MANEFGNEFGKFGKSRAGFLGMHLPVRLQWKDTLWVIAGTPGATGDAGWSTVECTSRKEIERLAAEYPQARMPAWTRMGL